MPSAGCRASSAEARICDRQNGKRAQRLRTPLRVFNSKTSANCSKRAARNTKAERAFATRIRATAAVAAVVAVAAAADVCRTTSAQLRAEAKIAVENKLKFTTHA